MRSLTYLVIAALSLGAIAGCLYSPPDADRASAGTSATTAAGGTGSTTGGDSAGTGTTGACQVDSDCHKSDPDECNICDDMRLICEDGACVCACQASSGTSGGASSTGASGSSGTSGGRSCSTDADCPAVGGVSQYCDVAVVACGSGSGVVTPQPGVCHRDCTDGSCACQTNADCASGTCETSTGKCWGWPECPVFPPCPADCPATRLAEEGCPICLCSTCPTPDAGTDACGGCGPGSTCCEAQGGPYRPDGGGGWYACQPLEADGGCPAGAVCGVSGSGAIESCNYYFP